MTCGEGLRLEQLISDATRSGLSVLMSGGGFLASLLANLFLVTMLAIFFLAEPKVYVCVSLYLVPPDRHAQLLTPWGALHDTLKTWLSTLFLSVSITMVLVWSVLGALGMPNILMVAVFAGLATFVPNIGVYLPLVPITVFSLVADPDRLPLMIGPIWRSNCSRATS